MGAIGEGWPGAVIAGCIFYWAGSPGGGGGRGEQCHGVRGVVQMKVIMLDMKHNANNVRLFMDGSRPNPNLQSLFMNAWSFGGWGHPEIGYR